MKTYTGNVEITKENQKEWEFKLKGIEKISGYVRAYNGSIALPACTEVGGDVRAYNGSKIELPVCTEVGGYVRAENGSISLPACTEVGGYVRAENGSISLPAKYGNKPKGIRHAFARKGYLFADNILSRIVSKKKQGQIVVYKTNPIGKRSKAVFVVQKGEVFSHGDTVAKATADLRYKIGDRDTSKYAKWTMDTTKPTAEIIQSYRVITGACEQGTRSFCEGKKLPTRCSVKVAIRVTKGQFGNEVFAKFFGNK